MRAFPVLPPVSRRATSAPAALDIRASVGTSTSPTSTGTKAVTGVGFTPKVVLPFGSWMGSDGASGELAAFVGAATSTSARAAIAVQSRTGLTTSSTTRRHTASKVLTHLYDSSVGLEADLSSFDAGGFTLNWSATVATQILNHICLGGADLEVSLTQQQMNGTNAAQSFAHGLSGGAPIGVLFFSAINDTAPANTKTNLSMSIGAWAGGNQFGAAILSNNGATTTFTNRLLATTSVLSELASGVVFRSMAVSSVDATNVNVTYPATVNTQQWYCWMLAIRGAKCQVGTFDCNGSTDPLTINTTGITPKLFLPVFIVRGVDVVNTVLSDLYLTIGASDGINNVSCGITDLDAQITTNARRYQSSNSLAEYQWNGAKQFEATAAFSGESVIVTPTTNSSSFFGQGAFLILGS